MRQIRSLVCLAILGLLSCQDMFDFTPPAVTLLSPTAGDTLWNSVTARAEASDNRAIRRIQLLHNDELIAESDSATIAESLSGLAPGRHTFQASALDRHGNKGWSDKIEVSFGGSNSPPLAPEPLHDTAFGALGWGVTLETRASDPDGDRVYIRFFYDIDNRKGWTSKWLGPVASREKLRHTVLYDSARSCRVAAQTRDIRGAESPIVVIGAVRVYRTWVYSAWSVWSEDAHSFKFTPALLHAEGKAFVYAAADGDSIYMFRDDGSGPPSVSREALMKGDAAPNAGPVISTDGNRVYQVCENSTVYCLNARTLSRIDSTCVDTFYRDFTEPAVAGFLLYTGRLDSLYCLFDLMGTPIRLWTTHLPGLITLPPAVSRDGKLVFCATDSGCIAVDSSGEWAWSAPNPLGGPPTSAFALDADGSVLVGCADGRLYRLDPYSGQTLGLTPAYSSSPAGCPVIASDGLVVACWRDGFVRAFRNLSLVWERSFPGVQITAAPCLAPDTTVIIHTSQDLLTALTLADGSLAWEFQMPRESRRTASRPLTPVGSSPVISGLLRRVYAGTIWNDWFCAVQVVSESYAAGLPSAPWPRFQHDSRSSGWAGAELP